jgi:G3E family GTPase
MNRRLPVFLVGGFLGAGKTSLLHHFISEQAAGNLAVLVENTGAPNPDAKSLRGLCGAMRRAGDTVLEIPALDEAAQIDWLAEKLKEFARDGRFERVLIEIGGTTNAARLGRRLLSGAAGKPAPWGELRQIVCVVDALDFFREVVVASQRGAPTPFLDFQRAQIEDASLIVLNKCDLVEDAERGACRAWLRRLNSASPLIETAYGELPAEVWSNAAVFPGVEKARDRSSSGNENPALSSLLYRAYRPFHPEKFWDWFNAGHPGLLRVKGLVWLATRNLLVGGISRTRWQNGCGGAGIWWAALPREEWPEDPEALARMQETWREPYGDRRQELVLIGEGTSLLHLAQQLDGCLLGAEEMTRPVREWTALPDPFPAWDVGE